MPDAEIRETIVVPEANGGAVVQLQISDAPLPAEDATILIRLTVKLPAYKLPLLAHLQREAMDAASRILRDLHLAVGQDIQETSYPPNPRLNK